MASVVAPVMFRAGSFRSEDETAAYSRIAMCYAQVSAETTSMRLNAILILLHCSTKPQNYGLVLACFSLSCNLGAITLSRVAFHMESEKHAVSSPPLKLPGLEQIHGSTSVKHFRKHLFWHDQMATNEQI